MFDGILEIWPFNNSCDTDKYYAHEWKRYAKDLENIIRENQDRCHCGTVEHNEGIYRR